MADRERTKTRDTDELLAEIESTDATSDTATDAEESRQRASRATDRDPTLRERAGDLFSPRVFLAALALTAVGVVLGGFVPLVGGLLGFVGVFLAAFVLGVASDRHHYPETGAASAVVASGWSVLGNFTLVAVGHGLPLIAASGGVGLVCGLLGHYFGRDLRDGLTREI